MTSIIQADKFTVGYDKDRPILKELSLNVGSGEFLGIIGKNGVGKSTLLKALRGFLPLQSGQVRIFGHPVDSYQQRELATKIAYLQQQVEMTFDYTVQDMVETGRYPYHQWWQGQDSFDTNIVQACMSYTGVLELAQKPIRALSGGQRQRVLLAKVLAQQTPLLFLDEPAAGLDLFYQEEIFRFCRELCQRGKTVLMVVHELNLAARYCTRLALEHQGGILADGIPAVVLTDELLTEAYGVNIRSLTNPETGHADIFTEALPETEDRHKLLNVIIGGTGQNREAGNTLAAKQLSESSHISEDNQGGEN